MCVNVGFVLSAADAGLGWAESSCSWEFMQRRGSRKTAGPVGTTQPASRPPQCSAQHATGSSGRGSASSLIVTLAVAAHSVTTLAGDGGKVHSHWKMYTGPHLASTGRLVSSVVWQATTVTSKLSYETIITAVSTDVKRIWNRSTIRCMYNDF